MGGGGFPDDGNGWHMAKQSYEAQFEFNRTSRAHGHYAEGLPAIIAILALTGLMLPLATTVIAYTTILLKLLSFFTTLKIDKCQCCKKASATKMWLHLLSDWLVYGLGVVGLVFYILFAADAYTV